jgi:hypothetical protein
MKGRPPKPQALEFLQGVRDARRLNFAEPQYPPASPTPPRGRKDDARAFWLEHAPALIQAGIMTIADKFAFVQLCWLYAWVRKYPDDRLVLVADVPRQVAGDGAAVRVQIAAGELADVEPRGSRPDRAGLARDVDAAAVRGRVGSDLLSGSRRSSTRASSSDAGA